MRVIQTSFKSWSFTGLSDSKSHQVSRILPSMQADFTDTVVYMGLIFPIAVTTVPFPRP